MGSELKPVKGGWYNAFRPWTLHGAVVPVLIGASFAFHLGYYCWWVLLLVAVGACLLQAAANLLNTYGDYVKGFDTPENHERSPELVAGILKPKTVQYMGFGCLGLVCVIGLVLMWYSDWTLIFFGIAGLIGAGQYTLGISYKYRGLGLAAVFVLMGILIPQGTYYVFTADLSWPVFFVSLPNALMITAVLSGNELRDYEDDCANGITTIAGIVGYDRAMTLYRILNILPYPILVMIMAFGLVPLTAAIAFLALYYCWEVMENSRGAKDSRKNGFMLVPLAFKHNWIFGVLLVAGTLVGWYFF